MIYFFNFLCYYLNMIYHLQEEDFMKEPLYKTILNDLKKQIFSGQLPLNSQLPIPRQSDYL
jgi:hypothetical protein